MISITENDHKKNDKQKNKHVSRVNQYVTMSFIITYVLLLTTATITFIEAMRTQNNTMRHIFNLETTISIVAAYFYSLFVNKIENANKNNTPLDWSEITELRYLDWSITTPMMLIVLSLALGYNAKVKVNLLYIMEVLALNYFMLYIGYLGEINVISRLQGMIAGFIAFFTMSFLIFMKFIKFNYHLPNYILFGLFFVVWTMYGIVYMFDKNNRNVINNILDCISKCVVGIFLWIYYTGIIKA